MLKEQLLSRQEENMLGSDSDSDGSDDEDEDMEDGNESSAMRTIARNLANASGPGNQEDYRLGKRPKAMRVGENGRSSALPFTLEDLMEDQPSLRHRGESAQTAGNKRGRGDIDNSSTGNGRAGSTKATKRDDNDRYNVVVGADGRVVVKELEPEEDEVEVAAKSAKRGKVSAENADGAEVKAEAKPAAPQKRRKLNLKEPGEEYKAKNAGGDVWKKGQLAPHAFIPLAPRLLSKKPRAQAIDHFGVVVKGGRNKRAGSTSKGKSESTGNFSRNRPKQKRHK